VDWNQLAQVRDQWQTMVKTVMKLKISIKVEFLE